MEKRNFITDDLKKFSESDLCVEILVDFDLVLKYLWKDKFTIKEMFLDYIECFLYGYTKWDTWDSIFSEIESVDLFGSVGEYCDDKVDIYCNKISKSLPDFYFWIKECNSKFGRPEDIYEEIKQWQHFAYEELLNCGIDWLREYYKLRNLCKINLQIPNCKLEII